MRLSLGRSLAWLLIFVSIGLRLAFLWRSRPFPAWFAARDTPHLSAFATESPGWAAWIYAVEKVASGSGARLFLAAAALSLVGPWFWYRFFRELTGKKTPALFGAVLCLLAPAWTAVSASFSEPTLAIPAIGLAFWLGARAARKRDLPAYALAAIAAAVAISVTPLVIVPAALALGLARRNPPLLATRISVAVIGLALVAGVECVCPQARTDWLRWPRAAYANAVYALSSAAELQLLSPGSEYEAIALRSPVTGETPLSPWSRWSSARAGAITLTFQANGAGALSPDPNWNVVGAMKENAIFFGFGRPVPAGQVPAHLIDVVAFQLRWGYVPCVLLLSLGLLRGSRGGNRACRALPLILAAWTAACLLPWTISGGSDRLGLTGAWIGAALLLADRKERAPGSTAVFA